MNEWDSSWECKYFSISTNQSMWYTSSTNWRIKTVYDHLNRRRKVFDKIHHPFMIKISRKWAFREHQSVQFSRSVVLDYLGPHESQHARPPCPSPTPGFTQTHVHRVSDAIHPSHLLSSPSPPAPNPSQHQRLFQWVNTSHEVAKVLEFQL